MSAGSRQVPPRKSGAKVAAIAKAGAGQGCHPGTSGISKVDCHQTRPTAYATPLGIGEPEPLRQCLAGTWSRRRTADHRRDLSG